MPSASRSVNVASGGSVLPYTSNRTRASRAARLSARADRRAASWRSGTTTRLARRANRNAASPEAARSPWNKAGTRAESLSAVCDKRSAAAWSAVRPANSAAASVSRSPSPRFRSWNCAAARGRAQPAAAQQRGVAQPGELALVGLDRVGVAEDVGRDPPRRRLGGRRATECLQRCDAALQDVERRGDLHVARVLELRHGLE